MKVLHILHELKHSGAEIMYIDAAPVFQSLGCELAVVNTTERLGEYAPVFEQAGYKVHHWPYPKSYIKRYRYYSRVIAFLKQEQYDVVHIHSSAMKWGMSYCAWRADCKAVYTFHNVFHSLWYSFPFHWWLRWSAKRIFGCIFQTISDSVYENEKNYYHNETIKIYNWYGNSRFFPAKTGEKEAIRHALNIPQDALVIISVGGCSHIKRHTDIIKAIPYMLDTHPDLIYLHLGEGVSLDEEKQLVATLNIEKHVRFCGNRQDVRKYLIASDIYIMTSKFEGISISTVECMACMVPAVLYDVPGLRDYNREKECAAIIPEDYHILATTVIGLFADKKRQDILTANGKALADNQFNLETNVGKIFQLYKSE